MIPGPDQIQALVAKCLVDPIFLARTTAAASLAGHPDGTSASSAARMLSAAECLRLQQFQGFITKVKHNTLRRVLPNTFRLLAYAGLELRFFVRFSEAYTDAREAGPLECAKHLDLLGPALASFLIEAADTETCAALIEMFEHERLLYELSLRTDAASTDARWVWNGNCAIAPRHFDVVALARQLMLSKCDVGPFRRSHYLLYQAVAVDATTRISEVDVLTALILSQLIAGRSVAAIAQQVSTTIDRAVSVEEVRAFVQDAIDAGIVSCSGASAAADSA